MADRKLVIGAVIVVVIVVIVAAVTAYYLTRPAPGPSTGAQACSGSHTYSGTVTDSSGGGLGGVVVVLAATAPNVGTSATVTTSSSGAWRATLSDVCAYTATLYWQSSTGGPRLRTIGPLNATSNLQVSVSHAPVTLRFFREFPNTAGENASVFLPDKNLTFSVDAVSSGSIPLGFLPRDDGGAYGYNFTYAKGVNVSGTGPYAVADTGAIAYRVVDANGNWVVYATPGATSTLKVVNVTETLNVTQGIAYAQANLSNPYQTVGAHQTFTRGFSVTSNATHLSTGIAGMAFGTSLPGYYSIITQNWPNTFPESSVALTNSGGGNVCFVVFEESLSIHAWYYAAGRCP